MTLEKVVGLETDLASRDVVEKHDEGIVSGKDRKEKGQRAEGFGRGEKVVVVKFVDKGMSMEAEVAEVVMAFVVVVQVGEGGEE